LEADWKRGISTVLATEGKGRQNPTKRWQTKCPMRGGDCGDYDYDDHYGIKHSGLPQKQPSNPGHSQTDSTFRSPVRAMISATIRVSWFCAGTCLAVVSSATGPTECIKY
jgi:hypothetical protein